MPARINKFGILNIQACVPSDWSNEQVENFVNTECPSGTCGGWMVKTQDMWDEHADRVRAGDEQRNHMKERVVCLKEKDHVHVVLVC